MKIAICLSGDIIDWRNTFITIYDLSNKLRENFVDISIDIFCHFWEDKDIQKILSRIDCKSYVIDPIEKSKNRHELIDNRIKLNFDGQFDKCILSEYSSDFYSMKISSFLKKEQEVYNDFQYDACLKLSYNVELTDSIDNIIDNIKNINYRHVYSKNNNKTPYFPYVSTSMNFFLSDSITFDLLSSFYDGLPLINLNIFHEGYDQGSVFFYYLKMFNLKNVPSQYELNKLI